MQGKYKVVTLCGSTRFREQFMQVQKELTLAGCIVISVGLFGHSGVSMSAVMWATVPDRRLIMH